MNYYMKKCRQTLYFGHSRCGRTLAIICMEPVVRSWRTVKRILTLFNQSVKDAYWRTLQFGFGTLMNINRPRYNSQRVLMLIELFCLLLCLMVVIKYRRLL